MRISMVGNFGLRTKGTMVARALPIAAELARRGHAVTIALPPWDSPEDSGERESRDGVEIVHVVVPPSIPVLRHVLLTAGLIRAAWQAKPDALVAFKPKAYAGLVLATFWLARILGLCRCRLVLDTDDWEGEGGWNERERDRFTWLGRAFISWHEKWCLRRADVVVAASRELVDAARRTGARRVFYVPLSVPSGLRPPEARAVEETRTRLGLAVRPVVLAYTRFAEFEPVRLAATFRAIHRLRPEVAFLLVGRGLHGEEVEFRRAAEDAGVSANLVEIGWVDASEVSSYVAAADVAVHLFDDNLMNRAKGQAKLLELLAIGIPTVIDAVGQACEYVHDGESGMLVPPGDVEAMAAAAIALLDAPDRRSALSRRAVEDVADRWTWRRWTEVYESAIAGRGLVQSADEAGSTQRQRR